MATSDPGPAVESGKSPHPRPSLADSEASDWPDVCNLTHTGTITNLRISIDNLRNYLEVLTMCA